MLLSAFDNNGSYDQIGFSANQGTWALAYSWTTGPPNDLIFHYTASSDETIQLTQGATYNFSISFWAGVGVALFAASQINPDGGSTPSWSANASTGGSYLVISEFYSGIQDYTDYEEMWYSHTSGGFPNFDFNFSSNSWTAQNHTTYPTIWTTLHTSLNPPSNVAVQINGDAVFIDNFYGLGPGPTIEPLQPLSFPFGFHEGNITWHPNGQLPAQYSITVNNSPPFFNDWYGNPIDYSVDNWAVGNYVVTCTVYDTAGRSAASTVSVTISPSTFYLSLLILIIVASVIGITFVTLIRKRRKTKLDRQPPESSQIHQDIQ
ncbi:MAG TPA: hypothetical protein VKK79_20400 [Candidatus Lokiarchaeia archaeon]|nr:hypothetical protein [Candidatus Lokiarchaeia archaeon]